MLIHGKIIFIPLVWWKTVMYFILKLKKALFVFHWIQWTVPSSRLPSLRISRFTEKLCRKVLILKRAKELVSFCSETNLQLTSHLTIFSYKVTNYASSSTSTKENTEYCNTVNKNIQYYRNIYVVFLVLVDLQHNHLLFLRKFWWNCKC